MKDIIIATVKELFESGRIQGFLGLRMTAGNVGPYLFTDTGDLDELHLGDIDYPGDARYSLPSILSCILSEFPGETIGVLVRGCDERALNQLINDDRVTPIRANRVIAVGFSCPPELARSCQCVKPWPDSLVAGEKTPGFTELEDQEGGDLFEEMAYWYKTFDRCLKCFGCRNVCPVCSCKECTIEREIMVPQREIPPAPEFLMTRALHMIDRCVYCGKCEETCPADIPLKSLYRFVARMAGQGGLIPGVPQSDPFLRPTWPISSAPNQ